MESQGRQIFRSQSKTDTDLKAETLEFVCGQVIRGDVKIHFYHQNVEIPMFSASFNVGMLQDNKTLKLTRRDLDYAYLDNQNKNFNKDFKVELTFKHIKVSQIYVFF